MEIRIKHVSTMDEAKPLVAAGWEPVECSFGCDGSALGRFSLDHHGSESHRDGVALRAYRDHYGALASDPRFIVTGDADEDATFAIAALCGLLPHPSLEKARSRDLTELAILVNDMDVEPIRTSPSVCDHRFGATYLLWGQLASGVHDASAFHAGVDRWRLLTGPQPPAVLLTAATTQESERVRTARAAESGMISEHVALVESDVAWGFDLWYSETPGTPIAIAFSPLAGSVTVGCRDVATAERLFGPSGLKSVFDELEPRGWGGRESIGGGPRGVRLTRSHALKAAEKIAQKVDARGLVGRA